MKRVSKIDIMTRVEGHGSIELIRDGGRVVDAHLNIFESPRLFEALLVGRSFVEIADIACRICSICSTVHKVSALQAVESAVGVTISRQTGLLRELAVQGGQIESHALHIFCLALPDYLNINGIQQLAKLEPKILQMGLKIKKVGNLIQEIVGGRAIHPFNLLVGGIGKVPEAGQLQILEDCLAAVCQDVTASISFVFGLDDVLPLLAMLPYCVVSGGPPLFGDRLTTSAATTIFASSVVAWLNESVELYSNAKVSHFRETTPYFVGPLARLAKSIPSEYASHFADTSIRSSLKARIIELQQAVERAQFLIKQLLDNGLEKEMPVMAVPAQGEGISLMEAPRGVLLHSYRFNDRGVCCAANIITPTAINQGAINMSLKELVAAMDGADYNQIRTAAEILVRCYDPCISCAVH
ncbi:MAG: nickel-dependent hydrogenase large subunit [Desulfuromonadaceae bacterium]|nr:nickel-dependent hydrogenase large subunit [Desulfuromonadaceae bacterium]